MLLTANQVGQYVVFRNPFLAHPEYWYLSNAGAVYYGRRDRNREWVWYKSQRFQSSFWRGSRQKPNLAAMVKELVDRTNHPEKVAIVTTEHMPIDALFPGEAHVIAGWR